MTAEEPTQEMREMTVSVMRLLRRIEQVRCLTDVEVLRHGSEIKAVVDMMSSRTPALAHILRNMPTVDALNTHIAAQLTALKAAEALSSERAKQANAEAAAAREETTALRKKNAAAAAALQKKIVATEKQLRDKAVQLDDTLATCRETIALFSVSPLTK